MKSRGNFFLSISFIFCIICVSIAAYTALSAINAEATFVPPPFDTCAEEGLPEVPEELGWSEVYQDGMSFSARICGAVNVEDNVATLYFTNTTPSNVWLMLRVLDSKNHVIGQTGLIRPNEYIEKVALLSTPEKGSDITLKIMAYEPETYYSLGTANLNTYIASTN